MTKQFSGFPREAVQFLQELSFNNNRKWFSDHKERYLNSIVEPMTDFIVEMGDRLFEISPYYRADTKRNGGSMFRIYRDTRFGKNKTPYKENIGCQFRHESGKDAHAPGYYVHIQPGKVFIGGGLWNQTRSIYLKFEPQSRRAQTTGNK